MANSTAFPGQFLPESSFLPCLAIGFLSLAVLAAPALSRGRPMITKWEEGMGHAQRRRLVLQSPVESFREGYQKFKKTLWSIWNPDGEVVVVPIQYADVIRKLPDDVINNVVGIEQFLETKYLGLTIDNPHMNHFIKTDLMHNLGRVNTLLADDVDWAVKEFVGPCPDWTAVPINRQLLQIIATVSSAVFLGPELSRNPEWRDTSIHYTVDLFKGVDAFKVWPKTLRGLAKYWIPEYKTVHRHQATALRLLGPTIRERRRLRDQDPDAAPHDMLQWLVNKAPAWDADSEEKLAVTQLTLSVASIHTTGMMLTNLLYDLVGRCPEVIPDLRAEMRRALAASDGALTTQTLSSMKLLDSVMRESQRTSPTGTMRMPRRVLKTFTLPDGTTVPAGADIAVPLEPVLRDGEYYTDPDVYDPYRFYRLRNGERPDPLRYASPEQYQFVSITKENMTFGWGRHACPGRFFAAHEIKLIVMRILLDYDIKMPDGVTGRYPNIVTPRAIYPDPTKVIMMRRRADAEES